MTCLAMKVKKRGYDKSLSTGELIDFNGKQYVIIFIDKTTSYTWLSSPVIEATVVGQEVGSPNPQEQYFPISPTKKIFKNGTEKHGSMSRSRMQVGSLMSGENGIVAIITKINKVEYSFVDVIVEYEIKSISEWSQREMGKAVKQNRISKFKVISGGKMNKI